MIANYNIGTVRSVSDLLADLSACRQLRHVSIEDKLKCAELAFSHIGKRIYVWLWEALEEAFQWHGYACDICGNVTEGSQEYGRKCAERAIDNMDGQVKLMLCRLCSNRFTSFSWRFFDRDVRVRWTPELERIMLAYVAFEVLQLEKKVRNGQPIIADRRAAHRKIGSPIHDAPADRDNNAMPEKHDFALPAVALGTGGIAL